jgi:predicted  nucleic acid-binding Zn-ribbon protein
MTASILHLVTSVLLLINLVLTGKTLRDTKFHAQTETLQVFAQLRLLFSKLEELASHTKDQLSTLNSELVTHNSKLSTLSSPLAALAEAQTQNIIKEGESNRNLRRRLQQKEETLVAARKAIKDQESRISKLNSQLLAHRDTTHQALEKLLEEISLIRAWMEDRGMPSQSLDKHLSLHYKGDLPSTLAQRAINAKQFQATLRGIKLDVLPANPKHAKTS